MRKAMTIQHIGASKAHATEKKNDPAKRTGNVYQGDKFIFEWHEIQ
jgi:hypothetical protein